ncbi:MAG: serine acetyltransferase [Phycisphaeraceae bacterium]|nr:serine acetyltransferase [Phycisphaeraceae bacterium]
MDSHPTTNDPDARPDPEAGALVDRILGSYATDERTEHLDAQFLPSRAKTIEIIEIFRRLLFPGFFDEQRRSGEAVRRHIADLLARAEAMVYEQVNEALCYASGQSRDDDCSDKARQVTRRLLDRIPELRRLLATDVQAAFDGDPAAVNTDEAIFCYPGFDAIFIHRLAHELYTLDVVLLPRIMSEYAHNETGIDIHPGATIGESFFIDHGTGVVIGETTVIGRNVQIYQGVTLGALAPKEGQTLRGRKRHPTIDDDVVIYPNATILGGDTVIGKGCVINGSLFLTRSVPPGQTVRIEHPRPELRARTPAEDTPDADAPRTDRSGRECPA